MQWPSLAALPQKAGAAVLGEDIAYKPLAWPLAVQIRGVFAKDGVVLEPIDGVEVETRRPVVSIHLADVPTYAGDPYALKNDEVTARGTLYKVRGVQPDGEGDALLVLELA